MRIRKSVTLLASLVFVSPLLLGAQGDGCAVNSQTPAPDVTGAWDIAYDDRLDVEINIGGAVYTEELGAQGGVITIEHDGQPLSFDLNCAREEILCPSEAWPTQVTVEQREAQFEHRMIVNLPEQRCNGRLVAPDASACGEGTNNESCEQVCDGEIEVRDQERFGVIGENGDSFRLYLGAGIATNGINCALLGYSVADAQLSTDGTSRDGDWVAVSMDAGLVTVGYSGGCLWAGDPDMDEELEAIVIAASVKFTTGFTGQRSE